MSKSTIVYASEKHFTKDDIKFIKVNDFDETALNSFYEKFLELEIDPQIKVIPILINSYGGEVYSLLGMIDIIQSSKKPVATIALGKAMSCGAVLLSAGTKGYRYCGENSQILIHEVSSGMRGKDKEIQNSAANTKKLNTKLMRMLATNAGKKDIDFFIKMNKEKSNVDLYLTSSETKSLGLVDHISVPKFLKG